jgi:hypothetical protein
MKRFAVPSLVLALAATMMAAPQSTPKKDKAKAPTASSDSSVPGAKGTTKPKKAKKEKKAPKAKDTTTTTK